MILWMLCNDHGGTSDFVDYFPSKTRDLKSNTVDTIKKSKGSLIIVQKVTPKYKAPVILLTKN